MITTLGYRTLGLPRDKSQGDKSLGNKAIFG